MKGNANMNKIPVLNIRLMPDDEWNRLGRINARENYVKHFGHEPASTQEAVDWQKEYALSLIGELDSEPLPTARAHFVPVTSAKVGA